MALTPAEQAAAQNRFQLTTDPAQLESQYRTFQNYSGTPTTAITADSLQPVKPLTIQPTTPSTTPTQVSTSLTNQANNLTKQAQEYYDLETGNTSSSLSDYQKAFNDLAGVSTDISNLPEQASLLTAKQSVDSLNSQIEAENQATKVAIDKLTNDPNMTIEQRNARVSELQRQSASKVADLSVALSAQTRNVSTLQDAIQNKITLLKEPLQLKYDFFKTFYQDNKQDLTKAEDRLFQAKETDYKNQLEQQSKLHDNLGKIVEQAALGGAPASVISQIWNQTNEGDAYSLAGSYLRNTPDNLLKEAQVANYYQNIAESKAKISSTTGQTQSDAPARINSINLALNDPNFSSVFGIKGLIAPRIPGSAAVQTKANIDQIIETAALASRGQLKGQGQISDFEGKMLRQAVASLNYKSSPEDAKQALIKLRGAIATSSGLPAAVKITDKNGNSSILQSTQDGIKKAINDGLTVEYQ